MMTAFTRRNAILAAVASTTIVAGRSVVGAATPNDDTAAILAAVDPELREVATRMLGPNGLPPLDAERLANARKMNVAPDLSAAKVRVEQRKIPGPKGAPDVTIYIINPRPAGSNRPAILHTHGGGFVIGTARTAAFALQDLCLALDCPAVSVEYRLAPETTYAGSVEDNYAGLKWLHANAESIGADSKRLAVLGESAGGGHAALLALLARDRGEVPVAFQCLIYPMLDDRTGSTREARSPIGRILWTPQSNRFGWSSFLGVPAGSSRVPARAVPARVADLSRLPPTFIGTGAIDLFVDEDIDYGQRLLHSGVATEIMVVPGAFHGFDALAPDSTPARNFHAAIAAALRKGLSA